MSIDVDDAYERLPPKLAPIWSCVFAFFFGALCGVSILLWWFA